MAWYRHEQGRGRSVDPPPVVGRLGGGERVAKPTSSINSALRGRLNKMAGVMKFFHHRGVRWGRNGVAFAALTSMAVTGMGGPATASSAVVRPVRQPPVAVIVRGDAATLPEVKAQ